MICITGAGGTVGGEVLKQLESAKAPFRAAYFSEAKAEAARARGIDSIIIDYNRPESLRAAFRVATNCFYSGPARRIKLSLKSMRSKRQRRRM